MNVLHVIGPMTVGGAQTQLLGLVRAGHDSRWSATVCATSPGPMLDRFHDLGVPVVALKRRGSPGLGRIVQVRRLVQSGEFDVVHSNLWQSNAYARLAVALGRARPAVVISERNVEASRRHARRGLDRALARWTDAYVANSTAVEEFMRGVHPCGDALVRTIPNAVDRGVFHPGEPERTGQPGTGISIGSLGRLDPEKGFDLLIEAVRRIQGEGSEVTLRIGGVGPLEAELRRAAEGLPVEFLGQLEPGEEVAAFLRSLDVFVLPATFREGRPNVLLEALCCGVPVVATDIPGNVEAVGSGGVLVAPGSSEALAAGIRAALDDGRARERALSAAERIPSFDDLAESYLEVFKAAVMRARRC